MTTSCDCSVSSSATALRSIKPLGLVLERNTATAAVGDAETVGSGGVFLQEANLLSRMFQFMLSTGKTVISC